MARFPHAVAAAVLAFVAVVLVCVQSLPLPNNAAAYTAEHVLSHTTDATNAIEVAPARVVPAVELAEEDLAILERNHDDGTSLLDIMERENARTPAFVEAQADLELATQAHAKAQAELQSTLSDAVRARVSTHMMAQLKTLDTMELGAQSAVARHEMLIEAGAHARVRNDRADSGGCTPLTVWENNDKNSYWWNWEKRLPELAAKTAGKSDGEASAIVMDGLGNNNWLQYIDGWAQDKGENSFGPEYIADMRKCHGTIMSYMKNGLGPKTFGLGYYDQIHNMAFSQTAVQLGKVNGFRGSDSWIYLPLPDKPLGVFHDIHNYGKLNYDPRLRVVDRMTNTWGLKWNGGKQYRWIYPNTSEQFNRQVVDGLFAKFWSDIAAISQNDPIASQREAALSAVVMLYHSLENFHCFIDGNGRTNVLVLQTLLSYVGLHPVSFYNSMESALCSVEEMREKVLEGYWRWEEAYQSSASAWVSAAMEKKAAECTRAVDQLMGKAPTFNFGAVEGQRPDTMGGCTCRQVSECDTNTPTDGSPWCNTDDRCTWKWDFCAGGRKK